MEDLPIQDAPDERLDRLELLLEDESLADAMRLDEIQGFLCAALAGPQALGEERWLPLVLGSDDALRTPAGMEAADLLCAYAAALENELAAGDPPDLIVYPNDGDEAPDSDYLPWCEAYLAGVDAADEDWFDALGDGDSEEEDEEINYVDDRLFPMLMITGEAEAAAREHGEEWPGIEEQDEIRKQCEEDLPQAVADLYRFWRAKRGTPTLRRSAPKVGRNDPCPCGSGRKFKACCGLAQGT